MKLRHLTSCSLPLSYIPFWYWIIGGGAAMVSGFVLYIGIKALGGA